LNKVLLIQLCASDLIQRQLDKFGAFELEEVLQELVIHELFAPAAGQAKLLNLICYFLRFIRRKLRGCWDFVWDWRDIEARVHSDQTFAKTANVFQIALHGPTKNVCLDCIVHFLRLTVEDLEAFPFSLFPVNDFHDDVFILCVGAREHSFIHGECRPKHGVDGRFGFKDFLQWVETVVFDRNCSGLEVDSSCFGFCGLASLAYD